jgi:hypothetical protein
MRQSGFMAGQALLRRMGFSMAANDLQAKADEDVLTDRASVRGLARRLGLVLKRIEPREECARGVQQLAPHKVVQRVPGRAAGCSACVDLQCGRDDGVQPVPRRENKVVCAACRVLPRPRQDE